MVLTVVKNHWAFLEEIEAPMWVDLDLETKRNYQDLDDAWFCTSHLFHQSSSRQLKAAFAHSGESSRSSKSESKGSSSQKIPSSVSRTRGKEFKSKEWKGLEENFELNKQHPVMNLNGKFSGGNSRLGKELKPKLSFIRSSGCSVLQSSGAPGRVSVGNAKGKDSKAIPRQSGLDDSSSLVVDKANESNTSTITSESNQQLCQRNPEIASQPFGHSSSIGLVSALKISLRKSCATRPALRLENGTDGKRLRDRNSSCSKSSVGSSSCPRDNAKNSASPIMLNKERTPDSRTITRMTEAAKSKAKESNMPKASDVRQKNNLNRSSRGAIGNTAKSACQDLAKPKVQSHAKALNPHRVNAQVSVGAAKVKEKAKAGGLNRLMGAGKENRPRIIMAVCEKCTTGKVYAEDMPRAERSRKTNLQQKCDRRGFDGQKIIDWSGYTRSYPVHKRPTHVYWGKGRSPSRGRAFTTVTQRVHLR